MSSIRAIRIWIEKAKYAFVCLACWIDDLDSFLWVDDSIGCLVDCWVFNAIQPVLIGLTILATAERVEGGAGLFAGRIFNSKLTTCWPFLSHFSNTQALTLTYSPPLSHSHPHPSLFAVGGVGSAAKLNWSASVIEPSPPSPFSLKDADLGRRKRGFYASSFPPLSRLRFAPTRNPSVPPKVVSDYKTLIKFSTCLCHRSTSTSSPCHQRELHNPEASLSVASMVRARVSVLNDALKSMYNVEKRGKRQVMIRPSSKLKLFCHRFRIGACSSKSPGNIEIGQKCKKNPSVNPSSSKPPHRSPHLTFASHRRDPPVILLPLTLRSHQSQPAVGLDTRGLSVDRVRVEKFSTRG
ncbi:structural constituent of ribosome [Stylosanthes scabra]|uniref:Structural constituent of ribosome n=1 Tax=Stylosanthes scabra TaxID=79078 RepID=A0ABU6X357_9FABA|nr:structural constituent of ribosome [Stylosanthes scabra]